MPDIKIFVSHRIDINSELIANPIYVPVRCGAVFDKENPMGIAGDNTGDNISERQMSFCEFTVQYWAWKNIQADYYGLCHYRRYLSFTQKRYKTDEYNMVHVPSLTPGGKNRYGLLDSTTMTELVQKYDIITSEYADVNRIPISNGKKETVRQMWDAYDGVYFKKSSIDILFELIGEMAPEYSRSAQEYFAGKKHRGFNCFVLRRELFERLCQFQFPIMFEIEHRLDTAGYSQTMLRTPAFLGEMLYGIFLYHVTTYETWRVKELQLVFFQDTERIKGRWDLADRYLWYWTDKFFRAMIDPICPKGSQRRERLKDVFYAVTRRKRRGVADIN